MISNYVYTVFCLAMWVVLGLITSPPLFGLSQTLSRLCTFANIKTNTAAMISYYVIIYFLVVDSIIVVSVTACYILIKFVHESQKKVKSHGRVFGGISSTNSYKNFILIALSVSLIWIPIQTMMTVSLSGVDVHPDVMNWFTVVILPINGLINPVLHTYRGLRKK